MASMSGTALFLALLLAAVATSLASLEKMHHEIHPLRPRTGNSGQHGHGLTCASWMLAVETHNLYDWDTVPVQCESYVGHYMLGQQYRSDLRFVVDAAIAFATNFSVVGDGKDVWIIDIDETSLSNLPYYATVGFGVEAYNATLFDAWMERGVAPPLPETLRLFMKLLTLGFRVVFISERTEDKRRTTALNLIRSGYITWEKLLLRPVSNTGRTVLAYKSNERRQLEADGYRIVGSIGDQWSDLLGMHSGLRIFKLPDPMYYIA